MKKLFFINLIWLLLLPVSAQGIVKDFFKYSTLYGSFNQSNSMVQEDLYAVRDGVLTVLPMEYEPNYTFSVGLRKLARFKYEIKAKNFYDGSEMSMSEEANVGNVSGFEYVLERSEVRLTGRESLDQRYFIRHLSKWFVAELDFLENGRADVKYLEAALKLRIKVGKKLNFTALGSGVIGSGMDLRET